MSKFGIYSQGCRHPDDKLIFDVTGSIRFIAGDVVDDQADHVYCSPCGREVTRWFENRQRELAAHMEVIDGI